MSATLSPPTGDPFAIAADALVAAGWPEAEIVQDPRGAAVLRYDRRVVLTVWGLEWRANVCLDPQARPALHHAIVTSPDPTIALKHAMKRAIGEQS